MKHDDERPFVRSVPSCAASLSPKIEFPFLRSKKENRKIESRTHARLLTAPFLVDITANKTSRTMTVLLP